jgi:hypothetical protein
MQVKKHELKTTLKAAARVTHEREFFIIGSRAVHAHRKHPPAEVLLSQECNLCPRTRPQAAVLLDRELGPTRHLGESTVFTLMSLHPRLPVCPTGGKSE